jgi:hypothetical protein
MPSTYRRVLRHNTDRASVPYGYTAMNVAGAGALIDTHGAPTTAAALLFLCGAISGFTAVAVIAGHVGDGAGIDVAPWRTGLASGAAAINGFALAALVSHAIDGPVAFAAAALVSTMTYFHDAGIGATMLLRR